MSLSGTVVGADLAAWTGGAGTVKLRQGSSDQLALMSTALNADGSFSFDRLPAPAAADLELFADAQQPSEFCSGSEVASDAQLKTTQASLSVEAQQSGSLSLQGTASSGSTPASAFGSLFYADRPATVRGQQSCTIDDQVFVAEAEYTLVRGWNQLVATTRETPTTTTTQTRNGTPDQGRWVFGPLIAPPPEGGTGGAAQVGSRRVMLP